MTIKQSDIFNTVDKYLGPPKDRPKLVNLIDMLANNPAVGGSMPGTSPPIAPGVENPSLLRGKYDESIDQMVKPEPLDPNLFKFQGKA